MIGTIEVIGYLILFALWLIPAIVVPSLPVGPLLVATSTVIVLLGSIRSLHLIDDDTTKDANGKSTSSSSSSVEKEILSASDAYRFPIVGGIALCSLYVAFKYFKDQAAILLSIYFAFVGVFTLSSTLSPIFSKFISGKKVYGFKKKFPLIGDVDALFSFADFIALILSSIFSYYYITEKKNKYHFLMNNVLGVSFCIQSLERISIGSYKVGAILLCGLFFYDIFFVFGTDIMVTVAKNVDGPIKLLFPRKLQQGLYPLSDDDKGEFSLLGLGDIVIPGLFVALLLRFDFVRAGLKNSSQKLSQSFPMPYFIVNIISYALGLVTTVAVMVFFKQAQPALLYLVPACLLGSLAVGLARSEFAPLFAYDEEATEKDKKKKDK